MSLLSTFSLLVSVICSMVTTRENFRWSRPSNRGSYSSTIVMLLILLIWCRPFTLCLISSAKLTADCTALETPLMTTVSSAPLSSSQALLRYRPMPTPRLTLISWAGKVSSAFSTLLYASAMLKMKECVFKINL